MLSLFFYAALFQSWARRSNLATQLHISIEKICVLLFTIFPIYFQFQTDRPTNANIFIFLGLNFTFNLNKTLDCEKKNITQKTLNIKRRTLNFFKKKEEKMNECCAWDLTEYTIYCIRFARIFHYPFDTCVVPSSYIL